jgi:hypothetical protein
MNFKTLLPWLCVLGVSAGLAAVFVSSRAKDEELAKLRAESGQIQQLNAQLAEAQDREKLQVSQIADLRKDNEELLRLRAEISQLRGEKTQLARQVQTAQSEAQRAQSQAALVTQTATARAQQLSALQNETAARAKHDACVANLRLIFNAKLQWATDQNKTADAMPTAQDLAPYLKDTAVYTCPAAGSYTMNPVGKAPACSFAGHVLVVQ